MPILHKNINNSADIHNPKWFDSANNGDYAWRNEVGDLESTDELVLISALDFVDASVAPPTTNTGDIYVLASGGSVEAGWGGVSLKDWVRYDGTNWNEVTPQKSTLCYDKTSDSLKSFNGTEWVAIGGGISNVTTAEKVALSPATGDFVYDTDLESLQRYNSSDWVDISKGYGLSSVNSSTGVPTYYTDLQDAFDATSSTDTVYIHSSIELTSSVLIPQRDSITIDMQGHRIWGDTTGSDFHLLELAVTAGDRIINFIGGGVIETIGTAAVRGDAAPISFDNVGAGDRSYYFNDVKISSVNGDFMVGSDFTAKVYDGIFYSENAGGTVFVNEGVKVDCYESFVVGDSYRSEFYSRYGGFSFFGTHRECRITGICTKSGNYALAYLSDGSLFYDNTVIADSGNTKIALWVRSSVGADGEVERNLIINHGTTDAVYFTYGSTCIDNTIYAENGHGLGGNAISETSGNRVLTNGLNKYAISSGSTLTYNNTAICLNAANTKEAFAFSGISDIFENTAIHYNPAAYNIKLYTSTVKFANNTMGSVGLGLDLNGFTNAMTNVPDAYNNIQIG